MASGELGKDGPASLRTRWSSTRVTLLSVMDLDSLPLQEFAEFAAGAAQAAGDVTLRYFQKLQEVEYKADRSPVTVADRESEALLRQRIEKRYPEHGILGEELGLTRPEAGLRWLLDPIDGTESFIHGVPLYGVMLGLVAGDDPVVGVVHFPALYHRHGDAGAQQNRVPPAQPDAWRHEAQRIVRIEAPFADIGAGAGGPRRSSHSLNMQQSSRQAPLSPPSAIDLAPNQESRSPQPTATKNAALTRLSA